MLEPKMQVFESNVPATKLEIMKKRPEGLQFDRFFST